MTTRSKPLIFNPSSRRVIDIVHSGSSVNGLARTAASVRRHLRQNSVIGFDDSPSSQSDDSGEDEVSDDSDSEEEDKVYHPPLPLKKVYDQIIEINKTGDFLRLIIDCISRT